MHNHEQEAAIMKRFGVSNLPAASEYTLPQTEVTPSFYVVSALLSQGKTFDVAASYLSPTIENNTNRFELDFSDSIPEEVFTICKLVSSLGGRALLVGGCIRDFLYSDITTTKITPKDFDLEIYGLDFDTVTRMLITAFPNNKCEFKGKSFGVTKLYFDGLAEPLDIAIPRTEVSTGEKHTDFETVMNPQLDFIDGARRRDLRFNSITYDPLTKTIYDPFLGLLDLQQKEINVTDPETFIEDPLRVLRIMQFAARFEMTPTNETVSLCTRMVAEGKLDHLAAERVRDELKKLLIKGTKPSIGLRFIQEIGYLERYWPELQALVGTPQHQNFHPEGDVWEHTLQTVDAATLICEREHLPADKKLTVMLTILFHDVGKPATTTLDENGYYRAFGHEEAGVEPTLAVLQRLMFENKTQKEVAALLPRHMIIPSLYKNHLNGTSCDTALRRLSRKLWKEAELPISMLMHVTEADQRGRNGTSTQPLTDDEAPQVVALKKWLDEQTTELQVQTAPKEILLNNKAFLKYHQVAGGPWLGIINRCIELDQDEALVNSPEEAFFRGKEYLTRMQIHLGEEHIAAKRHHQTWATILELEDPRILFYPEH